MERRSARVGRIGNGDHIPMGTEVFPKNRIVGFANLPALEVEVASPPRAT